MPYVVFDVKGILMPKSCIEQFGKDLTLYNIKTGSTSTLRSLYAGIASALAKNFENGYAYRFAHYAFRGVPKRFVEECSEKYRKLVPDVSKRVVRNIKDLGIDVAIITHDVHSLLLGVYDVFGFDLERDSDDLMDNDFSFRNGRVSGIVHDKDDWPRVHDKALTLREYMFKKRYRLEDGVLVVHGPEERSMASTFKNRTIVPEKGSCRELKENAMGIYKHRESLPEMLEIVFERQRIL